MKDSGFMFRIFGACLHVVFECCFPPRRAMCIQQLLESWKQSSWILCPGTWSTPKKCPTNFFVPSWPVVFLPNAHGLHGGKISHRVNARFPMQSPLAQEVPAGGWESPGVRWPVARSCSKISALLSYVSPNGAFWQEPSICLCRQVFDCTIPDSNWCPPFVCMIFWSIWNIENSSRFFWNMAMADLSTLSCFCGPLVSIWNKDLQLQVAKHWNTTREGEINASIRRWCNVGKPSWFLDVYVLNMFFHVFPDVVICWYLLFRLSSKAHCQWLSQ